MHLIKNKQKKKHDNDDKKHKTERIDHFMDQNNISFILFYFLVSYNFDHQTSTETLIELVQIPDNDYAEKRCVIDRNLNCLKFGQMNSLEFSHLQKQLGDLVFIASILHILNNELADKLSLKGPPSDRNQNEAASAEEKNINEMIWQHSILLKRKIDIHDVDCFHEKATE